MKDYSELSLTQKLLIDFRGEINTSKRGLGAVTFELFDSYLEEHPEYVTFYIDLFNISEDELEKYILSVIIIGVCRYSAVEDYLRNRKLNPWKDESFDEIDRIGDWKITQEEINRLMSLPKDQRLSYNPDDEIVVKEQLDQIAKNYEIWEQKQAEEKNLKKKISKK